VADWARGVSALAVDPESEVLLPGGTQEGTPTCPWPCSNPGESALLLDPYYPSHLGGLQLALGRSPCGCRLPERSRLGGPTSSRLPSSSGSTEG